ncbi:hypothetical protein F9B74_03970 [Pelistega sp. NLN82]|uniref:Uncharacterized protein n=1 Tax=Pelistega ratti TaxID=2652177 RepID=A0A6L9Y543_9BURK|nr:hypothetical protein [Pelistega ratti]NEN75483.1 hypothetical protein [Pelistega ratti]
MKQLEIHHKYLTKNLAKMAKGKVPKMRVQILDKFGRRKIQNISLD